PPRRTSTTEIHTLSLHDALPICDAPGGIKPGADGHDPEDVAHIRQDELERACETLGVTHLEMLGYHDSGMPDWEYKDRADVFCRSEEHTSELQSQSNLVCRLLLE